VRKTNALHTLHTTPHHHIAICHACRTHTSAYVSIRQHTSAYVSIRQQTSERYRHVPPQACEP
jgi:hypothetical protein